MYSNTRHSLGSCISCFDLSDFISSLYFNHLHFFFAPRPIIFSPAASPRALLSPHRCPAIPLLFLFFRSPLANLPSRMSSSAFFRAPLSADSQSCLGAMCRSRGRLDPSQAQQPSDNGRHTHNPNSGLKQIYRDIT